MRFLRQVSHGLARTKSFLHGAYHTTRKALQHVDVYSSMFRRVLAAAQPLLEDLGVQYQTNAYAMRGLSAYDTAKEAVVRGQDRYAQLARTLTN